MGIVGARNFCCRRATSRRVADDCNISAVETNESIDILNCDSEALEEESGSRIGCRTGGSAAYVSWGWRWGFIATSGDGNTSDRDQVSMRIVGARNFCRGGATSRRVANNGDVSAVQTNQSIDILDSNSKALEEESGSRIGCRAGGSAAYVSWGWGWSLIATSGDGNTTNRD